MWILVFGIFLLYGGGVAKAPGARALLEREVIGTFADEGGASGPFGSPNGMAIDETAGSLYVADLKKQVVDKFNLEGKPSDFTNSGTNALSGAATPAGSFAFPTVSSEEGTPAAVAVDNDASSPSFGDLYVLDAGHGVIDKFASSGAYLGQLTETPSGPFNHEGEFGGPYGVAVDGSGNVWVYEAVSGIVAEFNAAGVFQSQFDTFCTFPAPGLAVSSGGNVYVNCGFAIEEFGPTGIHVGGLPRNPVTGVAVDQANNHVITNVQGYRSFEFNELGEELAEADSPRFESLTGGIAVDGATGDLYLGNEQASKVFHLGHVFTVPDVETNPAKEVLENSAEVEGQVDPDGIAVTECEFEFGLTLAYGESVPCESSPGSGEAPVPVSAKLEGLEPDETYHYRLRAANEEGSNFSEDGVFITEGSPTIDAESVSGVGQTVATLEGEVDPHGFDTTYHFEYGETTAYGTSIPVPDEDIGSEIVDKGVAVEVSGLSSGKTYHYRIVATNSQGTSDGFDKSLTTTPPAEISGVTTESITSGGAVLSAKIDPVELTTTYQFEYGPTTAYGSVVPAVPGEIGNGDEAVSVHQSITNLQPNVTYHFRVAASNALGTAFSPDHSFVYEIGEERLPDGRAYEMVTPVQKGGARIGQFFLTLAPAIAPSGDRAILPSLQCFGQAPSCVADRGLRPGEAYSFTRSASGWAAEAIAPAASEHDGIGAGAYRLNAELGTGLFSVPPPGANQPDHWYRRGTTGQVEDIGPIYSPELGAAGPPFKSLFGIAATADLERVVFTLEENEQWPFDATVPGTSSLYEYRGVGQSEPELVAVSGGRGSKALISTCGARLGTEESGVNDLSENGEVVFFTAMAHPTQGAASCVGPPVDTLYARINGAETRDVSGRSVNICTSRACTTSPASNAGFQGASETGKLAYFTSTQQLSDEASEDPTPGDEATSDAGQASCNRTVGRFGCNLYLYDFNLPEGENIVDVSHGDTSGSGPKVQGVLAVSSDGTHVYFVAQGVLTTRPNAQGQAAVPGGDNLYGYDRDSTDPAGRLVYIATLSEADALEWGNQSPGLPANVTPNGRFLVFLSHAALTADDTRGEGPSQLYEFDDESGELVRLSKGKNGFDDDGNLGSGDVKIVAPREDGEIIAGPTRTDPTMSEDGSYVFFESPIGLTKDAANDIPTERGQGLAENIYEYHDGVVSLISDGRDTSVFQEGEEVSGVHLLGSDASGENVFFISADQLTPQDEDTQFDVFDARMGGGFSAPAKPVECEAESCHEPSAQSPGVSVPASVTFEGPGNHPSKTGGQTSHPLTRAQQLTKALKLCRKEHKKKKRKRVLCEKLAHRRYAVRQGTHQAKASVHGGRR